MSAWRRVLDAVENPIVVKEGVSRMRTWRAPVVATLYLGLIGAIGFAWLNLSEAPGSYSNGQPVAAFVGTQTFFAMALFQLALVCLFAPALAAGAISGERERQTLDVLLVSKVSAFGIVWGKLVASMAYIVLLILTALPLFAAVFLFGGIDFSEFAVSQLVTISTALCLGAVAIFFSALFQRSLAATVSSYAFAFLLTVGTAVAALLVTASQSFSRQSSGGIPVVGEWYANPFFALYDSLSPSVAGELSIRQFLQLLIFGTPPVGPVTGPVVTPWSACVTIETLLALAAIGGAVFLVRGRRMFRPRRIVEVAEMVETG